MCGIFGYVGSRASIEYTMEGLQLMEYRGYDSAGVVFDMDYELCIVKSAGKVERLQEKLSMLEGTPSSSRALGHTRWATHGVPSEENAHPHSSQDSSIVLVHNGIIENYLEMKEELLKVGYTFVSSTDTEIFVNYIEYLRRTSANIKEAFHKALMKASGAFAVAIVSSEAPNDIYAMRRGAPLVLGVGEDEYFLASDIIAFLAKTREVIFLDENEVVTLSSDGYSIVNLFNADTVLTKNIEHIDWDIQVAQKNGYAHYMLKEIYEQPSVIEQCLLGRIKNKHISLNELEGLETPKRIHIIACGTSYYAGLWGKYIIEEYTNIPVEVEIASEFRYRKRAFSEDVLLLAISQSGETADTLAGVELAKAEGIKTMALCNVVGSSLSRLADMVLYTQAGPEISVASTKAMTSQMLVLLLFALDLGRRDNRMPIAEIEKYTEELRTLKKTLETALPEIELKARQYAELCKNKKSFFYLGRGLCFPLALEGALKLKELSYISAEGYAAGEMKHGPIALVDEELMSIVLVFNDELGNKTQSAISEIRARNGQVIAIMSEGVVLDSNFEWYIPNIYGALESFIMLPALQLFSYAISEALGHDIDQPKNLAKSVTVE